MKKMILTIACGLGVSLVASAKLKSMTVQEMSDYSVNSIVHSSFNARQATIILELLAHNDQSVGKLTQKINQGLMKLNLERITDEQVYKLIRRSNASEFSNYVMQNNLEMVKRMMINNHLYNKQMLADQQRRAIIQTFIAAIVNSNLQKDPSLDKILVAVSVLNPTKLLQQYPDLISPIYSYGKPNTPNIDIVRNK